MPARRTGRIFSPQLRSQRLSPPPSLSLCITSGSVNDSMEIGSYYPGWVISSSLRKYGLLRSRDATFRVRTADKSSLSWPPAQPQPGQNAPGQNTSTPAASSESTSGGQQDSTTNDQKTAHENALSAHLLKVFLQDQKAIWTCPAHVHLGGRRLADTAGRRDRHHVGDRHGIQ